MCTPDQSRCQTTALSGTVGLHWYRLVNTPEPCGPAADDSLPAAVKTCPIPAKRRSVFTWVVLRDVVTCPQIHRCCFQPLAFLLIFTHMNIWRDLMTASYQHRLCGHGSKYKRCRSSEQRRRCDCRPQECLVCSGHENHPVFLVCTNENTCFIKAVLIIRVYGGVLSGLA